MYEEIDEDEQDKIPKRVVFNVLVDSFRSRLAILPFFAFTS